MNESLPNGASSHRHKWILFAGLMLVVAASIARKVWSDSGQLNHYAYQAEAFLHGRLDVENVDHLVDISDHNGRRYSAFPPFPAVVLMPFVALLGVSATRVTVVSLLLTIVNIFTLRRILKRLRVDSDAIPWLLMAFFLGTGYWLCVRWSGRVYFFAHIVAVTCLLLSIDMLISRRRCFLAGAFLGMAFLSRQLSIWSTPFLAVLLWQNSSSEKRKDKVIDLVTFVCPLFCAIAVYMVMNWARFGSPFDTGYSYMPLNPAGYMHARVSKYGLFHPAYMLFNFIYMFLQGPHFTFAHPTLLRVGEGDIDYFGTSITFASPFVFVALRAKWQKGLLCAAWISIGLALLHAMCYYTNGCGQMNTQRFTMDFMPILIILVGLGAGGVAPFVWKTAIAYAVVLNAIYHFGLPVLKIIQSTLA